MGRAYLEERVLAGAAWRSSQWVADWVSLGNIALDPEDHDAVCHCGSVAIPSVPGDFFIRLIVVDSSDEGSWLGDSQFDFGEHRSAVVLVLCGNKRQFRDERTS